MDNRELVLSKDASHRIVTQLLIAKFGEKQIQGLLSDDFIIEPNRNKGKVRKSYIRGFKDTDEILCDGKDSTGKMVYIKPEYLLMALDGASESMSYSNWAIDKFERISEIVIRYCMEHDIKISFKGDEGRIDRKEDYTQSGM